MQPDVSHKHDGGNAQNVGTNHVKEKKAKKPEKASKLVKPNDKLSTELLSEGWDIDLDKGSVPENDGVKQINDEDGGTDNISASSVPQTLGNKMTQKSENVSLEKNGKDNEVVEGVTQHHSGKLYILRVGVLLREA